MYRDLSPLIPFAPSHCLILSLILSLAYLLTMIINSWSKQLCAIFRNNENWKEYNFIISLNVGSRGEPGDRPHLGHSNHAKWERHHTLTQTNLSLLVFRKRSCNFFHLVKVLYSCHVAFSPYLLRGFHVNILC